MICPYCSQNFADAETLVEHLESRVCQLRNDTQEVDGLAAVMARQPASPNRRAEPKDFGIL